MDEKQKYEKIILKISLYAGMAFVVVELLMSLWSNSQAILMDAVFDAAELIVIGLSLFLTPLFYQPVSEKKPYGYSQFESVFIIVKGFMLISVTIGLITNNIQILLQGGRHLNHGQISAFEFDHTTSHRQRKDGPPRAFCLRRPVCAIRQYRLVNLLYFPVTSGFSRRRSPPSSPELVWPIFPHIPPPFWHRRSGPCACR